MSRSALKRQLEKTHELVAALPNGKAPSMSLPERRVKHSRENKHAKKSPAPNSSLRSMGLGGLMLIMLGIIALAASLYSQKDPNLQVAPVQLQQPSQTGPEVVSPATAKIEKPLPPKKEPGLDKEKLFSIITKQ